jgi:di/tripeptidase
VLESRYRQYEPVNFDAHHETLEDHLAINMKATWVKTNSYYLKLDESLVYYAASGLHPRYKYYYRNG